MGKTILIIGADAAQSKVEAEQLNSAFTILQTDCVSALSEIEKNCKKLSAIVFNVDGNRADLFSLVQQIRKIDTANSLPIVAIGTESSDTVRETAFSCGVDNYFVKPCSRELLVLALKNAITVRETAALSNTKFKDPLTGILTREAFFNKAKEYISNHEVGYYILTCLDIENFKVINDQYGTEAGDTLLRKVADEISGFTDEVDGLCCRFMADKFGVLYPAALRDTEALKLRRLALMSARGAGRPIRIRIGRYLINDVSLSVSAMFDRAAMAEASIKGRYDIHLADYSDSMRTQLLNEQQIVIAMDKALLNKEFEPWLQPQYNHATGALIGAEALVRWKKDGKYISPAEFVPVFERNGFIYEMDQYVWESVCQLLRKWLDEGKTVLPVSINISRRDLYHGHLIPVLTGIIDKYALPYELLRLEVTESAFSDTTITAKVNQLINMGFIVEIDDFGSGYSSLNTLKDVPASILKLDMKFFENTGNSRRGGNIIESVVRMAKWLGMAVIAEGVEEKKQADYLQSIGCYYIQGYYYAKPMPAAEYEKLLEKSEKEANLTRLHTLDTLDNNEFWNPNSIETLIFNSYVGGACVFEYRNRTAELLRMNKQYAKEMGRLLDADVPLIDASIVRFMDTKTRDIAMANIEKAIETQKESSCELVLTNGQYTEHIRMTVRIIAHTDDRFLCYSVIQNLTEQREAERLSDESEKRLSVIMSNVNGGVSAIQIFDDGTSKFVFNNDKYYELYGYTKEEAEAVNLGIMRLIVPEDFPDVMAKVKKLKADGIPAIIDYRCVRKDGRVVYLRANSSKMEMQGYGDVITSVVTDITEKRLMQEQLQALITNINGGVTATVMNNGKPEFLVVNDQFFKILGYKDREEYEATVVDKYTGIHPDDLEEVKRKFETADGGKTRYTMEYRIVRLDGEIRNIVNNISVIQLFGLSYPVSLSVATDETEKVAAQAKEHEAAERLRLLNNAAREVLAQPDSERAVQDILRNMMKFFAASRGYVVEINHDRNVTDNTYEVCADGVAAEKDNLQNVPFSCDDFWYDALVHDRCFLVQDVAGLDDSHAQLKKLLREQDISAILLAPLWRDGQLLGFVGVDNPTKSTDRIEQMTALADYVAVLLTRRDLTRKIDADRDAMHQMVNDTPGGFLSMELNPNKPPRIVSINQGFCDMLGWSHAEVLARYGDNVGLCFVSEDISFAQVEAMRSRSQEGKFTSKCRLHTKTGDLWVMVFGRFIEDVGGRAFINSYFTDISAQIKAEQQQRDLLDNLPCGAALYEFDGKQLSVVHINKSYWQLVGREETDYGDASVLNVIHEDDRDAVVQEMVAAIKQGRNATANVRILCGDGKYRPFKLDAKIEKEKNGKHLFFVAYYSISEREMSIQEMLPIALSTMMSASGDMSYVKDKSLHYICCSPLTAELLGLSSVRDVVGKSDLELFPKEIALEHIERDKKIIDTGTASVDVIEKIPDGHGDYRLSSTSKFPILDSAGDVVGLYGISRDITAQREKESQLELLTSTIPGGLAACEISGNNVKMLYYNDGFFGFSGYTREEYAKGVEKDPLFAVYEEDKPKFMSMIAGYVDHQIDGHTNGCIYRCHTKDGGFKWISMRTILSKMSDAKYIVNIVQMDITEQQEEKERLLVSEQLNKLAIEQSGNIITRFDVKERTLMLPNVFPEIFVLPHILHNMPEEQIALGRVSSDTAAEYSKMFFDIIKGKPSGTAVYKQNSTKGWRWLKASFTTVFQTSGEPVSAVISFADITEKLEKEIVYDRWQQSLKERREDSYTLLRCNLSKNKAFDSRDGKLLDMDCVNGKCRFDEFTLKYANQKVFEGDRDRVVEFLNAKTLLSEFRRGHRCDTIEFRETNSRGEVRWLRLDIDLVEYPNSKDIEIYLMFEDIDEQKKAALLTLERSETDPLTGILNRTTFIARMEEMLESSSSNEQHALLMLDIDNFKHVNDTLGHGAGDKVLCDLTAAIGATLRSSDLLGRMGGDEFFVFLKDVANRDAVVAKATQISTIKIRAEGSESYVTASIGIAMIPKDGTDFDTLYKLADTALYHQKKRGKNGFLFADE